MKPLVAENIYGNWGTLLLPINSDESIDYTRLAHEIDILISHKVNGIYSNGTAGEFYNITEEEFFKISLLLAEKCNAANMPFQIGVSHMSPMISLDRLKKILPLQPSAIQVILPDWFTVTNAEAVSYLQVMAENAGELGLVLYNPPHAKRNLQPKDFGFLQQRVPNLVGVKVAGGDEKWYRDMKSFCAGLSIFVPGHHLATGYSNGAHGAYSNVACINPLAAQKWYETIKKDRKLGLEIEIRISRFLSEYINPLITNEHYSNQAVDKCLAAIGGWANIGTRLRWPYKWIPEDAAISLRPIARDIIPEFFES